MKGEKEIKIRDHRVKSNLPKCWVQKFHITMHQNLISMALTDLSGSKTLNIVKKMIIGSSIVLGRIVGRYERRRERRVKECISIEVLWLD